MNPGTLRRRLRPASLLLCSASLAMLVGCATTVPAPEPAPDAAADARALLQMRVGFRGILDFMAARPDLFPTERTLQKRMLTREQREEIWSTWQSFLDHMLAVDAIGLAYSDLDSSADEHERMRAFDLSFAAFLAEYRFALDFIAIAENDPSLHVVLNEPVPELGLPSGTYADIKYRFLNVLRAVEFAGRASVDASRKHESNDALRAAIGDDAQRIWRAGAGRGPLLTAENGLQIVRDAAFTAWFPVQKGVSEWMGDVRVHRVGRSLVRPEQIRALVPVLEPGDVLLERREWFLSNVGLPGFWPHAALYVGTEADRRAYFDDPDVKAWLAEQPGAPRDFEELLALTTPDAYAASQEAREHGHTVRVLEAMSEGVVFTSLEHSADADSVAVLRPRLAKRDKAAALARAFAYAGRPYDFDFDFLTDETLVCTELVAKAYEARDGTQGLRFPLLRIVGRQATPANEIARQFDAQHGTPEQQLDFVLFLDGYERAGTAVEADLAVFRESWKRPKWHVLVQGAPPEDVVAKPAD